MHKKYKLLLGAGSAFGVGLLGLVSLTGCSSSTKNYKSSVQIMVSSTTSVLADKSFSQTTYKGMTDYMNKAMNKTLPAPKDVQENTGIWVRPTSNDQNAFINGYKGMKNNGAQVILAPGFTEQAAIQEATTGSPKNDFSETGFILIDSNVAAWNASSILFRADQSGFLAGIAASQMLASNYDTFKSMSNVSYTNDGQKNHQLEIGGYYGFPGSGTSPFLGGMQQGINYWNKTVYPTTTYQAADAASNGKTDHTVHWDYLGKTIDAYSANGFGSSDGVKITNKLVSDGVDVVVPVAGPQTPSVVGIVQNAKHPTVVVGVDTAQETDPTVQKSFKSDKTIINNGNPDYKNDIVQMSIEKSLDTATAGVLDAVANQASSGEATKKSTDGKWSGLGYLNVGTLDNKGVRLSEGGQQYLITAMKSVDAAATTKTVVDYDSAVNYLVPQTSALNLWFQYDQKAANDKTGQANGLYVFPAPGLEPAWGGDKTKTPPKPNPYPAVTEKQITAGLKNFKFKASIDL